MYHQIIGLTKVKKSSIGVVFELQYGGHRLKKLTRASSFVKRPRHFS
jgi:hypothetical protein